jgi:hypothetical protein
MPRYETVAKHMMALVPGFRESSNETVEREALLCDRAFDNRKIEGAKACDFEKCPGDSFRNRDKKLFGLTFSQVRFHESGQLPKRHARDCHKPARKIAPVEYCFRMAEVLYYFINVTILSN